MWMSQFSHIDVLFLIESLFWGFRQSLLEEYETTKFSELLNHMAWFDIVFLLIDVIMFWDVWKHLLIIPDFVLMSLI